MPLDESLGTRWTWASNRRSFVADSLASWRPARGVDVRPFCQ